MLLAAVVFINYYMLIMVKNGQVSDTTIMKVVPILVRSFIVSVPFGSSNKKTA